MSAQDPDQQCVLLYSEEEIGVTGLKEALSEGGKKYAGWEVDREKVGLLSRKGGAYSSAMRMVHKLLHKQMAEQT